MTTDLSSHTDQLVLDSLRIPPGAASSLEAFREWAQSEDFPEKARIDYLAGSIEVDMSPEDLQTHGSLKGRLFVYIDHVVSMRNLGQVFVDCTALSSDEADLHCEPDVVYVSLESLRSGRARYRPSKRQPGRYTEIEGAADLVVEVLSDSSVQKDRKRLPPLYARAGVRELWLVDAWGAELEFQILHLHEGAYRPAPATEAGFQQSQVLARSLRLLREPWELPGTFVYRVEEA